MRDPSSPVPRAAIQKRDRRKLEAAASPAAQDLPGGVTLSGLISIRTHRRARQPLHRESLDTRVAEEYKLTTNQPGWLFRGVRNPKTDEVSDEQVSLVSSYIVPGGVCSPVRWRSLCQGADWDHFRDGYRQQRSRRCGCPSNHPRYANWHQPRDNDQFAGLL